MRRALSCMRNAARLCGYGLWNIGSIESLQEVKITLSVITWIVFSLPTSERVFESAVHAGGGLGALLQFHLQQS